jgi:hypothetical protein
MRTVITVRLLRPSRDAPAAGLASAGVLAYDELSEVDGS